MVNLNAIPQINWNEGSDKTSKTPLFEEKLVKILSDTTEVKDEFHMNNGDVLCLACPANWEFQTYHESLKEYDGIFASKDLLKISRLAVCKNMVPDFDRFKRPIRANKSQIVVCDGERLVPLYKKGETWLSKSIATRAVKEVARIRGVEWLVNIRVVEIELASKTSEIKHIAWSFDSSTGEKFYCLFSSGYVFSVKPSEVLIEKELDVVNGKAFSGDFIAYLLPIGEKDGGFSLYNNEDGIRCSSDKILL